MPGLHASSRAILRRLRAARTGVHARLKAIEAGKWAVMKINFMLATFRGIRVDEFEILSQLDENKLRELGTRRA
ncbi:hypothetical protein AS026_25570 [Rhizobium altiplani]|uniref:Uncharacterized protein n=1 Tax=Rhizobium altiplani TaxID=1864509 RepID=A0A120FE43_9HYPH|nr:hypothetical protein AS026_25570 [Rhizobium altiplani]